MYSQFCNCLCVATHGAKLRLSRHSMLLINGHDGSRSVGASTPVVVLSSEHHKIVLAKADSGTESVDTSSAIVHDGMATPWHPLVLASTIQPQYSSKSKQSGFS